MSLPAPLEVSDDVSIRLWNRIAVFLVVLAVAAMFFDVLFWRGRVLSELGSDISQQFMSWRAFGFGELQHGRIALWNPYVFSGAPYFGGFQSALLYPPNWIHLVLSAGAAVNFEIFFNTLIAGLNMYFWARHRRLHPAACLLAGLTFCFSGAFFLHIWGGHLANLAVMAWAPAVFLAIDGMLESPSLKWLMLGGAAIAVQTLGGHPQYQFYTAVLAGIYSVLGVIRPPGKLSDSPRLKIVGGLIAMLSLGAALSAVQWLSGLDATTQAVRSHLDYQFASLMSFPPENLLTTILPTFFGSGEEFRYWGRWVLWEQSLFVGTVSLALAIYGAVRGGKAKRRFAATLALIALVFALGSYTPIFRLLYNYVPGFASFRANAKFSFLVSMFVAMLSAVGMDRLIRLPRVSLWPASIFAALAVMLLLTAGLVYASSLSGAKSWWGEVLLRLPQSIDRSGYLVENNDEFLSRAGAQAARNLFHSGIALSLMSGLWFTGRKWRSALLGIVLIGGVELFVTERQIRPTFELAKYQQMVARLAGVFRRFQPDARVYCQLDDLPIDAHGFDIWGHDPMILRRYAQFVFGSLDPQIETGPQDISPADGLLRLHYALDRSRGRIVDLPYPTALRAQLLTRFKIVPDETEMLSIIRKGDQELFDVALLESAPAFPNLSQASSPAAVASSAGVEVTDLDSDTIRIDVDAPTQGILRITDSYSTGWKASALPGSVQANYQVMPVDMTLRGIPISAGKHHILLQYRPTAFVIGAFISAIAWLGFIAAIVRAAISARSSRSQNPE